MFGYDWPRFHAAVNDLPVALLLVTVLFDLAAWRTKRSSLEAAARWTLWAGVAGGWVAVLAGLEAEDVIEHGEAIHELMETHETLALVTMGIFTVVLAWGLLRRARLDAYLSNPQSAIRNPQLVLLFSGRLHSRHHATRLPARPAGLPARARRPSGAGDARDRGTGGGGEPAGRAGERARRIRGDGVVRYAIAPLISGRRRCPRSRRRGEDPLLGGSLRAGTDATHRGNGLAASLRPIAHGARSRGGRAQDARGTRARRLARSGAQEALWDTQLRTQRSMRSDGTVEVGEVCGGWWRMIALR